MLNQQEPFRSMLLHLQLVIEQTIPDLELKFKYKIPFYYSNGKPFCYLNVTKGYVDVGFWKGSELKKNKHFLTVDSRKMIKSLRYKTLEEINNEVLKSVLKEVLCLY